eukprot:302676_1
MSTSSSFVGLRNLGDSGYLNAFIQTLFMTPEFRMSLFSVSEAETIDLHQTISNKRVNIIRELQQLFARLQCSDSISSRGSPIAPSTEFISNLLGRAPSESMDGHNLSTQYSLLLNHIEHHMPQNKKILNKHYKGRTVNIVECSQCHHTSQTNDDFVALNIASQNMNSSFDNLQQSLVSMYMDNEEELNNENAYFCSNCDDKVRAKKYCRLTQLPSIMVCNLNRFRYDAQSQQHIKIKKRFEFPKSLDLSLFVQNEYSEMQEGETCEYDLIGVIVYDANAEHCHAFVRDMNNEVDWKPMKRIQRKNNNNRYNRTEQINAFIQTKREKKDEATAILEVIIQQQQPAVIYVDQNGNRIQPR